LSLPPLPHGMSSQFMFPPDPSPGDPGAIAPAPAALVTIQPEKESVTSVGTTYSTTRVVSVAVPGTTSLDGQQQDPLHDQVSHQGGPGTPTHGHRIHDQEPQDLTPMQDVSNTQISIHGSPDTPGRKEKERNSRKQCPYCHKDFHEMSLKRHIKDVHFRNQNTYVICPQCCKQYASQNSLYSHLNRVHGVKKDEIHLQLAGQNHSVETETKYEHDNSIEHEGLLSIRHQGETEALSIRHQGDTEAMIVRQHHGDHEGSIIVRSSQGGHDNEGIIVRQQHVVDTNHEGIMDLAQHSDHSN